MILPEWKVVKATWYERCVSSSYKGKFVNSIDLTALEHLLQKLESRAQQWESRGVHPEIQQKFVAELYALQRCREVGCVLRHLEQIRILEPELPETDITLVRALQEAVNTWLSPLPTS